MPVVQLCSKSISDRVVLPNPEFNEAVLFALRELQQLFPRLHIEEMYFQVVGAPRGEVVDLACVSCHVFGLP